MKKPNENRKKNTYSGEQNMTDKTMQTMFSSKTDLWSTPQDLFDRLNNEFHFTLDVCANEYNHKCDNYYTKEQDGLNQPWIGTVWCNPPYGREISQWVKKAFLASVNGSTVVMLLPSRTDTKWFHDYIYKRNNVEIRFIKGRLKFGDSKNSAPFPSMIVIFKS
jgi:phage N-6-adenine-methyltransferase